MVLHKLLWAVSPIIAVGVVVTVVVFIARRVWRYPLFVISGMVLAGLGFALDWTKVDAEAGTLSIEGTVIRIPGEGLIVQPHTKSKAGMRTITPPAWVLDLFKRRHVESLCAWIFPTTRLTLHDPDNTRARLRDVVRGTPWEGLHPHAFRHLVATQLDRAGLSAREIADYLGHERVSMTQEIYMSRGTNGAAAAAALDRLAPPQ